MALLECVCGCPVAMPILVSPQPRCGHPWRCVCELCSAMEGGAHVGAFTSSMCFDDASSMCLALPSWKLFPRTTVAFEAQHRDDRM